MPQFCPKSSGAAIDMFGGATCVWWPKPDIFRLHAKIKNLQIGPAANWESGVGGENVNFHH
jgi:hypothetical protein